jgi:hypothetical protein
MIGKHEKNIVISEKELMDAAKEFVLYWYEDSPGEVQETRLGLLMHFIVTVMERRPIIHEGQQ